MAEQFDGYYKWLGIPPKDQPPNHYRLLGVELFEDNAEVIETAAERQATYLHEVSSGPHVKESQKLLNEIAAARLCLLNPEKKAAYDVELKSKVTANVTVDALPGDHSGLDDLPWDNLEPLMSNGSSSDTVPRAHAASETLPLPSNSSGVFSAPKSLTATAPAATEAKEAKLSKPTIIWLAVGGAAVVIAVAAAVFLLTRGDDDSRVAEDPPDQVPTSQQVDEEDDGQTNGSNENDGETKDKGTSSGTSDNRKTNGDKSVGDKPESSKANSDKKNGGKSDGDKKAGEKTNGGKTDGDKKTGEKTNGGKTNGGKSNGNKKPRRNGNGGKTATAQRHMKPGEFQTLKPVQVTSGFGTTSFTLLDDKSILAEGGSEEDVYTVQLQTDIPDISAIKVTALPHESLDFHGPGHGSKGGFSLTEVRVVAAPADKLADREMVSLSGVESKDAPDGIERLIDNTGDRFWAVRSGKPTSFTLFAETPISHKSGLMLYVQLAQREKLGHFAISVSNAPELAGKKTRIEAEVPIWINLGGRGGPNQGIDWHACRPFDGGAYGYVGGKPEGNPAAPPFASCISGIQEFRLTLPEGNYDVTLLFSGRFPQGMSQRSFQVSAQGAKKQTVKNLKSSQTLVPLELKGAQTKDGGLTIIFTPEKGIPVLNAIKVDKAK